MPSCKPWKKKNVRLWHSLQSMTTIAPYARSRTLGHAARHHKGGNEDLHGFLMLVERRHLHLQEPLGWTRL